MRTDIEGARRGGPVSVAVVAAAAVVLWPAVAHAYIGPGAGIAFASTLFTLLLSFVLVLLGLLLYPVRVVWRLVRRRRPPRPPRIRRAVLVGLDGLDPDLCARFMADGLLPNLSRLSRIGGFQPLATTCPAMSPVAWSSFATGVHPPKHGIFDFITRDPRTYAPDLSSAEVRPARRHLDVGPFRVPLGRPVVRLLRKSRPFWSDLARHGVTASVLRVPITFPPDRFDGTMLSAMCVPDLEGTQGTFTCYASGGNVGETEGGRRVRVELSNRTIRTWLEGPAHPFRRDGRRLRIALRFDIDRAANRASARVGRAKVSLPLGAYTAWVPVVFPLGFGLTMRGMCRFRLLSLDPEVRIYQSPIQIDPEHPVLPISHPRFFATYLAKLSGRYATLGLAEDTWALNEGVLDEDAFLEQAWANHREREDMFFAMLGRTRRGVVACVFDGTDRIQHMFMRYLDDGHPARRSDESDDRVARYRSVIADTYRRMDEMVGRVLQQVDPEDARNLVLVLSDHGFKTFRRGINVNTWLLENGYLHLKPGLSVSGEWFAGVDWSRTRAFALGLGGVFLNVAGRESQGIVAEADARGLADELAERLAGLVDPATGEVAIRNAYPAHRMQRGPYRDQSPDVIVGYSAGWRASWDCARGTAGGALFEDNTRAWSGDHCIDPALVPGVLIANHRLEHLGGAPHIVDIAPTVLDLFGIPTPRHMDGVSLVRA